MDQSVTFRERVYSAVDYDVIIKTFQIKFKIVDGT